MEKIEKRAINWIISEDTGISSKVIWAVMMGCDLEKLIFKSTPSDPSDFGRCYRLLKLIPEWESRLDELKKVEFSYTIFGEKGEHKNLWVNFVDNYKKLCDLYEEEKDLKKCEKLYNFMKEIF